MNPAVCPTCHELIDPARAPIARIRGGRVLSYCSTACAEATEQAGGGPETTAAMDGSGTESTSAPLQQPAVIRSRRPASDGESASAASAAPALAGEPAPVDAVADGPAAEQEFEVERARRAAAVARAPRNRRLRALAIAGAIVVIGMLLAVVDAVSPSTPSPAGASVERAEPSATDRAGEAAARTADAPMIAEPMDPSAPLVIDPAKARVAAVVALHKLMDSDSSGVRWRAAAALLRTGDAAANELLSTMLAAGEHSAARRDIAFALARVGDAGGIALLVGELSSKSRDDRLDAAHKLAAIGNSAGQKQLRSNLRVRNHRLSAAGALALLGDAQGSELLHGLLDDDDKPEDRMRAAVYLGLAGDATVREQLREIHKVGQFQVRAAYALAVLGDEFAATGLVRQLEVAALRVEAAAGLARLGGEVDLEPLVHALASEDAPGRVTAAEAILILTEEPH